MLLCNLKVATLNLVFHVIVVTFSRETSYENVYKYCHPDLLLVHPNVNY